MIIVVKGRNFQELMERIGQLNENVLDDLKELIEGTLAPVSEMDADSQFNASFANNMSFRQDLYKQLELVEGRKRKVEEKLAEIEDQ